jgi:hypothetical protein
MVRRNRGTLVTNTMEDISRACDNDKEGDREPRSPFQVPSYADLLATPEIPASGKDKPSGKRDINVPVIDAIIVPTIRSAEQLSTAVDLAFQARCQLIALYTNSFPAGLPSILRRLKPGMVTPLALQSNVRHKAIDIGAAIPQSMISFGALDISRKRNLGLLIGRACGWTRMLFLDDDIRRLNIAKLSSAAALLDDYPVVGLQVIQYPDASVVGHVRRLAGRKQDPFISGGSLLVDPQKFSGFFPPVYHEDWLCTINHLRHREVAIGGQVRQLAYQLFTTTQRAQFEEFGEIFAAGLLWLVLQSATEGSKSAASERGYWHAAMKPQFWEEILTERSKLLGDLSIHAELVLGLQGSIRPLKSLQAARQRCDGLSSAEFVSFMRDWLASLEAWQQQLADIRPAESVAKALTDLGLRHVVRTEEQVRRPTRASTGRPWRAQARSVTRTLLQSCYDETARNDLLDQGRRLLGRVSPRSAVHDWRPRLGRVVPGGSPAGRVRRPVADRNQAREKDGSTARGQQQPVGPAGWHEPAPKWAVQAPHKDQAGHGHT